MAAAFAFARTIRSVTPALGIQPQEDVLRTANDRSVQGLYDLGAETALSRGRGKQRRNLAMLCLKLFS
jgi:hypothetical protein